MTTELKPSQQIQVNIYKDCTINDGNNNTIDTNSPTQNSSNKNNKFSKNFVNIAIKGIVGISLLFVGYEIKILKIIFNAIL
jgi:hypothetical protein